MYLMRSYHGLSPLLSIPPLQVTRATTWYPAESYHQHYWEK